MTGRVGRGLALPGRVRRALTPHRTDPLRCTCVEVYQLADGRRVVGAGQKSGFYHALDATTGAAINQLQAEPGGPLGGLFADTAVSHGVVYANGINWPGGFGTPRWPAI